MHGKSVPVVSPTMCITAIVQIISFKLKAFDRRVNLVEEGKHDRKEERRKSNKTITEGEKERD